VLNFGVDGYGLDQAVLRYRRDVVAWHPDLVILGMIHDDFRRAQCVYGFLCFPGSEIPFAKPRFVSDVRTPVNTPLPAPDTIFAHREIAELPFVELDPAFGQRSDWEERFYHHSYAIRFGLSRFPRYPELPSALSDDAMKSLAAGLVRSFLDDAHANGSRALVVFFPSHVPICGPESSFTSHIARDAFAPARDPVRRPHAVRRPRAARGALRRAALLRRDERRDRALSRRRDQKRMNAAWEGTPLVSTRNIMYQPAAPGSRSRRRRRHRAAPVVKVSGRKRWFMLKPCVMFPTATSDTFAIARRVRRRDRDRLVVARVPGADAYHRPRLLEQVRRREDLRVQLIARVRSRAAPAAGHEHRGVGQQQRRRVVQARGAARGERRPALVRRRQHLHLLHRVVDVVVDRWWCRRRGDHVAVGQYRQGVIGRARTPSSWRGARPASRPSCRSRRCSATS
jgi:hypothetical protein